MENSGNNDNNIINNNTDITENHSSVDNRTDNVTQQNSSDTFVADNVAAQEQETKESNIVTNGESPIKEKSQTQQNTNKEEISEEKEQKTEEEEKAETPKTEIEEKAEQAENQKVEIEEQAEKKGEATKGEIAEDTIVDDNAKDEAEQAKEKQAKKPLDNKVTKTKGKKQKEFDEFGREILDLTFENILTMSKNTQKLHYSKIKNQINIYKYIKSKFKEDSELFYKGAHTLFCIKLKEDQLLLYCSLPEGSLDKKVYPHRVIKNEEFKDTPIQVTINNTNVALKRALELVNLVMDINGAQKSKSALPVAYAEKYPIKANAVLRGEENISPEEKQYIGPEYEDIQGEITKYLTEKITGKTTTKSDKKGKEKLEEQRQTAKSLKAAIALAEPIVYYYDVAVERDNNPLYINIQQVLNDRFLGKLVPQHFFAVAEGSERIEKLNFLALEAAVIDCNAKPEKDFVVSISCRLLIKKATLKKLIENAKTENENLIMAFDCSLLEALGDTAIRGITALKEAGIKILLDNIEQAGLRALSEFYIDYLRLDARYYSDDNPKTVSQLDMLTGYSKIQGIITVGTQVESIKQSIFMLKHGIDAIQGRSVSIPRRLVHVALKETKPLPVSGG